MNAFEQFASVQLKAEAITRCVDDAARESLLLSTAYRKRIKPVPPTVHHRAVKAFKHAASAALVEFDSLGETSKVLDKVCDDFWHQLDEAGRYQWLRRIA